MGGQISALSEPTRLRELRIWGNGWQSMSAAHPRLFVEGRPVYGEDYRRVVAASKLNPCFRRKGNRDRQTCRSLELPAMEAAMLHEASPEVERLFTPDREAIYFCDQISLVVTASRWLTDSQGLQKLGKAARRRVLAGGHDHHHRWQFILTQVQERLCAS